MTVETAADLASLFSEEDFAVPAVFTPAAGGAGTSVAVILDRRREDVPLGELGMEAEQRRLLVRASELDAALGGASPRGGSFVVAGETLRVKRATLDEDRKIYSVGLKVVTP